MIEYLAASTPTCFVVKFSGKLRGAEYKELIGKVESAFPPEQLSEAVLWACS